MVKDAFARYRESLAPNYRMLLDRFEVKDAAAKVVGVGSFGTACWILLLVAGGGDPLILQVKEGRIGSGGVCGKERLPEPWTARGERHPADAAVQRHLPGMDRG